MDIAKIKEKYNNLLVIVFVTLSIFIALDLFIIDRNLDFLQFFVAIFWFLILLQFGVGEFIHKFSLLVLTLLAPITLLFGKTNVAQKASVWIFYLFAFRVIYLFLLMVRSKREEQI